MFDIAMPLFETDDVKKGIRSAVDALAARKPRPVLPGAGANGFEPEPRERAGMSGPPTKEIKL
jgi:hypothetical protein